MLARAMLDREMSMERAELAVYPYRVALPTRWEDNDAYGHLNNVV
jgi:hypothetical protein